MVGSQMAIVNILAAFTLADWYRIAMHIICQYLVLADLIRL